MPIPSDEELLLHRTFVRRLAHHLLGDAEAAEDVAQDALMTAIERPPRDSAKLRSWLGTVTRRLAFRHLRNRDRQSRNLELLAAPTATTETPDSIAARRTALGQVTEAVQGLDDVHLEAVLLRYFEGLTPTEISRRLDVPLATVSSRLQRALAKLRVRLDDETGARWRAGLAAAIGLPPSLGQVSRASTHSKLWWSLIMTQSTATVALTTAALVFGGYLYFSSDSPAAPNEHSTSAAAAVPELHSVPDSVVGSEETRRPVISPPTAAPTRVRLVATLQWVDGTPARAFQATLRSDAGTWTEPVLVDERRSLVEFSELTPGTYRLRVVGSPIEHPIELANRSIERRTIELTPATEFRGRVSTVEGSPIAGAWIVGDGGDTLAISDERGAFLVRSLRNFDTFACRALGYSASPYRPRPAPSEKAQVVLTPGGVALEGWVTDPNDQPVAFTTVKVGETFVGNSAITADGTQIDQYDRIRVRTDADGHFFAVGLRPGSVPIRVPAKGGEWADWNQRVDLAEGATQMIRIRLQPTCSVAGLVRDRAGAPAARARIGIRWGTELDQQDQTYTDDAGHFRLLDLPPGPVVLTARAGSNGQCRERVLLQPGRETTWQPFLNLGTVGRVVDSQGQPVSGVAVIAEISPFEASVTTDERGEFSIVDCPDTLASVYVIAGQNRVLGHWSDVDVLQHGLFLRLAPNAGIPCTVTVRVLGPTGQAVEDARLSLGEPGEPARIGSGPPDEEGWIRLSGPIYGPRFEASVRSKSLGTVSLGVGVPDAEGALDFGTVYMRSPGQLVLKVQPARLRSRVDRFAIETLDGIQIVGGVGVPVAGLRLAPGEYRVTLSGDGLAPAAIDVTIESEQVTIESLEIDAPNEGTRDRE